MCITTVIMDIWRITMIKIGKVSFVFLLLSLVSCSQETNLSIDPALEGEWMDSAKNELRYVFNSDSTYFVGTVGTPYYLEDSGNTLNISNTTFYTRQTGDPSSIIGHWRDDSEGEDVYMRADGRYISVIDGNKFVSYGTYSVAQGLYTGYDYRKLYETNGTQIIFHDLTSLTTNAISYSISSNILTMGGKPYTKVP